MSSLTNVIDLDAARRESAFPDGIDVPFRGETYNLPGELPADVFDPFLTPEFDLSGLLVTLFKDDDAEKKKELGDRVVELLLERPMLPAENITAIYAALELLFGPDQWATFKAARPSIPDIARLVSGLFRLYGVSLGEAFASVGSVTNAGPTSKQTSPLGIPVSTPDASGDAPAPETASSESAG
jgi:hypothetical protein